MKKNYISTFTLLVSLIGITQTYGALPALQNYITSVRQEIHAGADIVHNNLRTVPAELRTIGEIYQAAWANRPPLSEIVTATLSSAFMESVLPSTIPSLPHPLAHIQSEFLRGMNHFNDSQFLPITREIPARRAIFTLLAGCAVADCITELAVFIKKEHLSIPTILGIYAACVAGTVYCADKIKPFRSKNLQKYLLLPSGTSAEVADASLLETTLTEEQCYICYDALTERSLIQLPFCKCTLPRYLHRDCYLQLLESSNQIKPCGHCKEPVYFPQQKVTLRLRNGSTLTNH